MPVVQQLNYILQLHQMGSKTLNSRVINCKRNGSCAFPNRISTDRILLIQWQSDASLAVPQCIAGEPGGNILSTFGLTVTITSTWTVWCVFIYLFLKFRSFLADQSVLFVSQVTDNPRRDPLKFEKSRSFPSRINGGAARSPRFFQCVLISHIWSIIWVYVL